MRKKSKTALARENGDLRQVLRLATNNADVYWQQSVHEYGCQGGPHSYEDECKCDGNYIVGEVLRVLGKKNDRAMEDSR